MKGVVLMNEKKRKNMDDISDIVLRYQGGDQASGEEILKRFGGHPSEPMTAYMGKFYRLIRDGTFDFQDRDSRRFIALFIEDESVRESLYKFYQNSFVKKIAMQKVDHVRNICSIIEDEDLKQELRFLLLKQALRWKRKSKKIGFTGYLYNSYRFALFRRINQILKPYDPYLHNFEEMERFEDESHVDGNTVIKLDQSWFIQEPMLIDDDELGNSWVRGLTCSDEFRYISPLQRYILKLYYEEGLSDQKIADRFSMHINTIHNHRKKAIKTVQETVARLKEEGYYD